MNFKTLLTHPGSAHKDELLACCLLLAENPVSIQRREPTESDLSDPQIAVIDVGGSDDASLGNFDHHHFPRDHAPTCSLSLVLKHMGLYEDAKAFCDWLEPAEWFDCRGPNQTAAHLGIERSVVSKLNSPVDGTLLRRFAAATEHRPGETIWEMMRLVGQDLLNYLTTLRSRLDFIKDHHEIWTLAKPNGDPFEALFLPRTEPLPQEPSSGIGFFLRENQLEERVIAMVYPDRRSDGYGISRYNDHPEVDFTRIDAEPDVHFAHKSGFVAKTTATQSDRLKQLVAQGILP